MRGLFPGTQDYWKRNAGGKERVFAGGRTYRQATGDVGSEHPYIIYLIQTYTMASLERVEKAVQDKVDHLKDVAKMGDLANTLSKEFTTEKAKLEQNKAQLPKILKGFDETQIHRITQNAEVKEKAAKETLKADVQRLISLLKGQEVTVTHTGQQSERTTTVQETAQEKPVLSSELIKEARSVLHESRDIIESFNPQNIEEVRAKLPELQSALAKLSVVKKVHDVLPAGEDKQDMAKLMTEIRTYQQELEKNVSLLNTPIAAMLFSQAKGQLEQAKSQARDMLSRFARVVIKYGPTERTPAPTPESSTETAAPTTQPVPAETKVEAAPMNLEESLKSILNSTPISRMVESGSLPARKDLIKMVSQAGPGALLNNVGTYYSDVGDAARDFYLQDIDPIKSNNYQIFEGGRRFIRRFPEGTVSSVFEINKEQFDAIQAAINGADKGEALKTLVRTELKAESNQVINFAVNTHGVNRDKFAFTVRVQPQK